MIFLKNDETVQTNTNNAEASSASTEELIAQVETLDDIIKQLVYIVSGKILKKKEEYTKELIAQ